MWWSLSPCHVQCGNLAWQLCAGQWIDNLQLLSCKVRSGGVLLYIRDDLSYNVTCMDPENMELLGITLYNGNQSNHFCLYAVYIFHHSPNVFVWVIVVPCMQISKKVVSVPCQVIVFVFVWVIVMPHMRICKKTVSVLSGKNSSTTRLVIATKWVLHLLNVKHRTVCIDRAL